MIAGDTLRFSDEMAMSGPGVRFAVDGSDSDGIGTVESERAGRKTR